jgi:hypothetical protein
VPFRSQKQRALFHAKAARGEISQATVRRWEEHTPSGKLPTYADDERKGGKSMDKHGFRGRGPHKPGFHPDAKLTVGQAKAHDAQHGRASARMNKAVSTATVTAHPARPAAPHRPASHAIPGKTGAPVVGKKTSGWDEWRKKKGLDNGGGVAAKPGMVAKPSPKGFMGYATDHPEVGLMHKTAGRPFESQHYFTGHQHGMSNTHGFGGKSPMAKRGAAPPARARPAASFGQQLHGRRTAREQEYMETMGYDEVSAMEAAELDRRERRGRR